MWDLNYKESWVAKNWCFWTVVLEKTLESPLDCKENQPVHPEDQSWVFIARSDVEAELQYFGHLMQRIDLGEKTLMLGKIKGGRRRGLPRMRWLHGITDSMDMGLCRLKDFWWTGRPGMLWFMESQRVAQDWVTKLNWTTENAKIQRILRDYYGQVYGNKMDNLEEMDRSLEMFTFED